MLIEKWHPVTHDFGLIEAPLENVVAALLAWHRSIGIDYERKEITTSSAAAFDSLPPLSIGKQRKLFVHTTSDWTAYYQNGIQGSDPFPVTNYLAKTMGVLGMRVCSTEAPYPANIWEVYAPESLGGVPPLCYLRSVAAMNDGGPWVFDLSGTPFEFEQVDSYTKPKKKDRFTRDMLCDYLAHFGIQPFSDSFLHVGESKPAVLLQQIRPTPPIPEYSLAEVVAGAPWKR
jgi:hypothetical protein